MLVDGSSSPLQPGQEIDQRRESQYGWDPMSWTLLTRGAVAACLDLVYLPNMPCLMDVRTHVRLRMDCGAQGDGRQYASSICSYILPLLRLLSSIVVDANQLDLTIDDLT